MPVKSEDPKDRERFLKEINKLAVKMDIYGKVPLTDLENEPSATISLEERLLIAVMMGSADTVKKALELGADLDYKNKKGIGAIDLARAMHPDLLSLLNQYHIPKPRKKTKPKKRS